MIFWVGPPLLLQSDNGKEFTAAIIAVISEVHNIAMLNGNPYTPNEQGSVENRNGTIKVQMAKALGGKSNRWIDVADKVVYAYNHTKNHATNMVPFTVTFS